MKSRLPVIPKSSTRAWLREARRVRNFSFFDLIHSYIYGRWPYFYIAVGTGRHLLARFLAPIAGWLIGIFTPHKAGENGNLDPAEIPPGALPGTTPGGLQFAHTYHGKVVPLESARQLVTVRQEIRVTNLEKVIPYNRARDIILQNPDHIVALDCPCRVARPNPCYPLDVCLIVGEPFASFVSEHQPARSRWITPEEAVEILKAEDARGHVHHAFFKDAMFGRFYAICNCCDCCCGAMQAHRTGTPMLAASGYRAVVELERCLGCGICARLCQFHAITLTDEDVRKASIDPVRCMGCGICVNNCSQQAISLQRDITRGEPLEIQKLIESV